MRNLGVELANDDALAKSIKYRESIENLDAKILVDYEKESNKLNLN